MRMKKVPKLRFPEFSGEWVEKKLGEVAVIKKGIQLNKLNMIEKGQYPVINGGINASGYTNEFNANENTITISEGGNSCGYVSFIKTKFWCGGHCYKLENTKMNKKYLYFVLKKEESKIMRLRVGSGLPNIQKNDLVKYKLYFPPTLEEQEKIAFFLSAIDEKIEIVSKKIEKLKEYKKGLLQKLLSVKDGEPELRFPQFSGKWVERRLGEVTKIYDGIHQTPKYTDSGVPFFSVENITQNNFTDTKFISEEAYEKGFKNKKIEKGDILITRIGDIGSVKDFDKNIKAGYYVSVALIKNSKHYVSKFLKFYIETKNFQKELYQRTLQIAFPKKINLNEIGKCKIKLPPTLEEQQKIASFLSEVDEKIEINQQKLTKLQEYKKGLLQQMLI